MRLSTKQLCIEAITIVVVLYLVMLMGSMTGYVAANAHFSDTLDLSFSSSGNYTWTPLNPGELKSIAVSGRATLQLGGYVRVSITDGTTRKLVYQTEYKPELNPQPLLLPEPSVDITGALSSVGLSVDELEEVLNELPVDLTQDKAPAEIVPTEPIIETPVEVPVENTAVESPVVEMPANETEIPVASEIPNETIESNITSEINETTETIEINETIEVPAAGLNETIETNITNEIGEAPPEPQAEPFVEETRQPEQSETFVRECAETCTLKDFANAENKYTLIVEVSNATVSIDDVSYEIQKAPKPEMEGISLKQGEEISDAAGEKVGKKVADDPSFETYFTFVGFVDDALVLNFYHNSSETQPVWIESVGEINYALSTGRAEQFENVSLNVTLQGGKIPKFRLHVGRDSDVFEFGITVITVQSYPAVGENWTVAFNTTGMADLVITGYNGTTFGADLEFLELACGNTTLDPTYNGTSVIYSDYACDEVGTETSRVITEGTHTLEFSFGDSIDYAHNIAGVNLSCTVRTACEPNETDVLHMSDTTDAHAELANGTDYSYKVCCRDTTGKNSISTESSGYDFLYLHNVTDSHSERRSLGHYANAAYIKANASNITCSYSSVSGACIAGTCLLTMSDSTDAHIADCITDPYDTTLCCSLESVGEPANYTTFDGSTTDFNSAPDINNVSQPVLEKQSFGKIAWSGSVNASGADLDSAVTMSTNLVSVNSTALHASFNSSATITLYGVSFTNPKPLWDPLDNGTFVDCPSEVCTEISYAGYNFTFSVTRFTGYSSGETPNTAPSQVTLFSPSSGSTTTDLTPAFEWENATDAESGVLTYTLQVDDDSDFGSPEISQAGIAENAPRTSYVSAAELNVDTAYFWRVRAYDGELYGDWSDTWNLTIESSASVSLPVGAIEFGIVNRSATYNTDSDSPQPFLVQNDGNVAVNVTIYGTDFWQRVSNPTSNYQFKCRNDTSICPAGSTTDWADMPNITAPATLVTDLPRTLGANQVKSDIKITAPSDEPAGVKSSTIYIIASQA